MKCPNCGNICDDSATHCDICRTPLPRTGGGGSKRKGKTHLQRALIITAWILSILALAVGIYKLIFWYGQYKINRLYTRGQYTPTVNTLEMDDGRMGHALIFYGQDGDTVYLPEDDKTLSICGGIARLEVADADRFKYENDLSAISAYQITYNPILIHPDGTEIQLPAVSYEVEVPESPLKVTSPASNGVNVVTSSYPIDLEVVAGSSVFINGEDLTDSVDRAGDLSVNVAVKPIGTNTYTVIVRTPHHRETRQDVQIYREKYDIEIELDSNVSTRTNSSTMTISGKCEPGASITVDTAYMEKSLELDMTTGRFSFIVQFDQLGDNVVRFHASMEGRQDATISFTINYIPTLAQYSAKAWKMDYKQLRTLFEQWTGKIFLCRGKIIDMFLQDGNTYFVMDVSTEGETGQYVILQNASSTKTVSMGPSYDIYADVAGRMMYNSMYYPLLMARYIDYTS